MTPYATSFCGPKWGTFCQQCCSPFHLFHFSSLLHIDSKEIYLTVINSPGDQFMLAYLFSGGYSQPSTVQLWHCWRGAHRSLPSHTLLHTVYSWVSHSVCFSTSSAVFFSLCLSHTWTLCLSPWLPSCRFIINSSHFLKSLLFLAFTWPPSSYPFTHPLALLRLH